MSLCSLAIGWIDTILQVLNGGLDALFVCRILGMNSTLGLTARVIFVSEHVKYIQ
jgi:hypothetical protein